MIDLRLGDCLNILPTLEAQSVDAIITDLPYGTTACKWDVVIPFEPMWIQVKRLLRPHGAFVTTASQPFTSLLVCSNLKWFKYELVWDKGWTGKFGIVKFRPCPEHENIMVFADGRTVYNPQMENGKPYFERGKEIKHRYGNNHKYGIKRMFDTVNKGIRFPGSILSFNCQMQECNNTLKVHPTQKPVALYEYLIRTYANEGDTVLDFCMGSGTTGVACVQLNRNFIGCELDPNYYEIAKCRIEEAQAQLALPMVAA